MSRVPTALSIEGTPPTAHRVRAAGYDDGRIVERVMLVALNTWTTHLNSVAQNEIDFPEALALAA